MTINAGNIMPDATTYVTPQGGTATTLDVVHSEGRKVTARLTTDTELLGRTLYELTAKDPVANTSAPGGYTQARKVALIKQPYTLANGNRTVNTVRIEVSLDPEVTAAESLALRIQASELLGRDSYKAFWDVHDLT